MCGLPGSQAYYWVVYNSDPFFVFPQGIGALWARTELFGGAAPHGERDRLAERMVNPTVTLENQVLNMIGNLV